LNTDLYAWLPGGCLVRVIFGLFWISDEFPQTKARTYLKLQYVWYFKGSHLSPYKRFGHMPYHAICLIEYITDLGLVAEAFEWRQGFSYYSIQK
jgi:hypothetical protein